jgi:hypothetical protein
MEIISWWITAVVIIFIFFGGLTSFALALVIHFISAIYFAGKGSKLIIAAGFLASGGISYWLCRYAMGKVELSFLDTVIAIIISLLTFTLTIFRLYKRSFL